MKGGEMATKPAAKQDKALYIRALFILLYCLIAYVSAFVVVLIAIFQFFSQLLVKKTNEHLLSFSKSLSIYLFEIIYFITFNTDEMPFPFKPWPDENGAHKK